MRADRYTGVAGGEFAGDLPVRGYLKAVQEVGRGQREHAAKEVAESVGLHEHLRDLLAAVRAAGIQVFIAPTVAGAQGWQRPGRAHMHAATELNGPLYAESVVTTSELIQTLPARPSSKSESYQADGSAR